MRIEIACFTENGEALARRIADLLSANATRLGRGMSPGVCEESFSANVTRLGRGVSLSAWTEVAFAKADALVFVGAAGIAVRAVAPLLVSKAVDPGVLVVDETGSYVIPILSGHIGGANELARRIARELSAEAVVTTATDRRGVFAADAWAARHGTVVLQPERIKKISANLLSGGEILWESDFSMEGDIPPGVQVVSPVKTPKDVQIFLSEESSARKRESVDNEPLPPPKGEVARRSRDGEGLPRVLVTIRRSRAENSEALVLVPKIVVAGVGCRRGVSKEEVLEALTEAFAEADVLPEALADIFSIDKKEGEEGLLEAAAALGHLPKFFTAEELREVPGNFSGSAFVEKTVGVDNVCERCAVLGAGGGDLLLPKTAYGRVTVALAQREFNPDFMWRT